MHLSYALRRRRRRRCSRHGHHYRHQEVAVAQSQIQSSDFALLENVPRSSLPIVWAPNASIMLVENPPTMRATASALGLTTAIELIRRPSSPSPPRPPRPPKAPRGHISPFAAIIIPAIPRAAQKVTSRFFGLKMGAEAAAQNFHSSH